MLKAVGHEPEPCAVLVKNVAPTADEDAHPRKPRVRLWPEDESLGTMASDEAVLNVAVEVRADEDDVPSGLVRREDRLLKDRVGVVIDLIKFPPPERDAGSFEFDYEVAGNFELLHLHCEMEV